MLTPHRKKQLLIVLKLLITLIICIWVAWELHKSWGKIKDFHWVPNYLFLLLSGMCYIAAYVPSAVYWRYVMQTLGQKPGMYETFRAYYIGHLGKYVPFKAMVLIVRAGLLNHQRTTITAAGAAVFIETMTMMAVGAFVAAVVSVFFLLTLPQTIEHGHWLAFLTFGVMIGTLLPIFPPVFQFVANRLKKYNIEIAGLQFRTLAVGWMLNIPVWIMLGVSLWLTMVGLGMTSESILAELPFCLLAIAVSVVFGFVSMLPGGLGTRELALLWILTPFFTERPIEGIDPHTMALVIVTVLRIISILSELILAACLAKRGLNADQKSIR